jgi:hypothetical protein
MTFFSAFRATDGFMNGVMATVIMVWALALVVATGRARRAAAQPHRT